LQDDGIKTPERIGFDKEVIDETARTSQQPPQMAKKIPKE
jgi:hypothetical protein